MTIYGYARVSTNDQDLTVQRNELAAAGCQVIREEKQTGTTTAARKELLILLEFLQAGDELVVTRMDRLGRSTVDLLNIVEDLQKRDVSLRILKQNIDITTSVGKLFVTFLSGFAEFESELRKERQAEGIARAKTEGKYKGRQIKFDRKQVIELVNTGLTQTAIARQLKCNERTIRRIIKEELPSK